MKDIKEKILQGTKKSLETFSINKLNDIICKSEKEKREYGLMFCSDTDVPPFENITYSNMCIGKECDIEISDCKDKKQIGMFHTHPHTKKGKNFGNLSGKDIYSTVSSRQSFVCIGLTENNIPIIKCFIPSLDIDPTITSNAHKAQDNYDEKLSNISKQKPNIVRKSVDELIDAYDKRVIANKELYRESENLAEKLLSKKADLIIRT